MDFVWPVLTVLGVQMLGLVSPGPNFLLCAKFGLSQSRRTALVGTVGIATGTVTHLLLGFLGLTAVVSQSLFLYTALKYVGAAYLGYLGLKAFFAKRKTAVVGDPPPVPVRSLTPAQAYRTGLLTMLSNPKAALFFLALFTTILPPDLPRGAIWLLLLIIPIQSWLWYATITISFSTPRFRRLYQRGQRLVDITFGALMIGLGLRLAFGKG